MKINRSEVVRKCVVCGKRKGVELDIDFYPVLCVSYFRYSEEDFICDECIRKYERGEVDGEINTDN